MDTGKCHYSTSWLGKQSLLRCSKRGAHGGTNPPFIHRYMDLRAWRSVALKSIPHILRSAPRGRTLSPVLFVPTPGGLNAERSSPMVSEPPHLHAMSVPTQDCTILERTPSWHAFCRTNVYRLGARLKVGMRIAWCAARPSRVRSCKRVCGALGARR